MCMYTMYVETNKTRLLHATYNHTYIHINVHALAIFLKCLFIVSLFNTF